MGLRFYFIGTFLNSRTLNLTQFFYDGRLSLRRFLNTRRICAPVHTHTYTHVCTRIHRIYVRRAAYARIDTPRVSSYICVRLRDICLHCSPVEHRRKPSSREPETTISTYICLTSSPRPWKRDIKFILLLDSTFHSPPLSLPLTKLVSAIATGDFAGGVASEFFCQFHLIALVLRYFADREASARRSHLFVRGNVKSRERVCRAIIGREMRSSAEIPHAVCGVSIFRETLGKFKRICRQ